MGGPLLGVFIKPLWGAADGAEAAASVAEAGPFATGAAAVVECFYLAVFAAPEAQAAVILGTAQASNVTHTTPPAVTYHALAHFKI